MKRSLNIIPASLLASLLALLVSGLVSGCGVSPRRGGTYVPPGNNIAAGRSQISSDPRTALNELDAHLRQQGYSMSGQAVHNPSLAANGTIAYSIPMAQQAMCYTVFAIANEGTALNITVLQGDRAVGANVENSSHPWVTVCGVQGAVTVRLQMGATAGEYYYAAYEGPSQNRPDLTALFTGAQQQQMQQAQIDAATQGRLTQLSQRLSAEGFQQFPVHGEYLAQQQPRNYDLNLQAGTCYAFATLAGPGAEDTDLELTDAGGTALQRDVGAEADALVRYCPQQSGPYVLSVTLFRGQGPVFTASFRQGGSGGANVMATTSSAGAGVDQNFALLDSDIRARGYEAYQAPSRGELAEGGTQDFSVQLEGGKCYAILAVGDSGVRDLDVALMNAAGQVIDQDVETDPRPIVRVCAQSSGQYTMQVRMFSGQGAFVFAPYRWPRGTEGPFGLSGLIYVRLAEVTSLLEVQGYGPDFDATPETGQLARESQTRQHTLNLAAGQCYSVLVVGGEGVNDLGVTLSLGGTTVAQDETRNAFPSVQHCTQGAGRYQLSIESTAGSGQYFYQIFRQSSAN